MKTTISLLVIAVIMLTLLPSGAFAASGYRVYINHYERNNIRIEFPKIAGMADERKQREINYLLEREVFAYISELFELWYDEKGNVLQMINNITEQSLELTCYIGYKDNSILSVWYDVYSYARGGAHPNTWGFAYTVDLRSERLLKLVDVVTVDMTLLESKGTTYFAHVVEPVDLNVNPDLFFGGTLHEVLNGGNDADALLDKLRNDEIGWYLTRDNEVAFFGNIQNTYFRYAVPRGK